MNTQSISIDKIISTLNSKGESTLSLAENFIELIRPYQFSDVQAISLFNQVKQRMSCRPLLHQTRSAVAPEHWALLPC